MQKHIVITVFGSLGDLHPLIALGMELQARGHRVTMATTVHYREKIEAVGLGFYALRPEISMDDDRVYQELFDPVRGPETMFRKYIFPYIHETYADLKRLLSGADVLINSPLILPGPLLARELNLPWASVGLQPFLYFSAFDPPVLAQAPISESWRHFGPWFWRPLMRFMKSTTHSWGKAFYKLQQEAGVAPYGNPIFEGSFSPYLNLGLFSPILGAPQKDWPPHTAATGFLFFDEMTPGEKTLPQGIQDFLAQGSPPVVFTLGSSAVRTAGPFFEESLKAVKALGCRAIFVAGDNVLTSPLPETVLHWDYVSYSLLFPHALAIVHQGGAGTTAQAMRAGKPMVIVPFGFDQFDNAARLKRLGISQTILRKNYNAPAAIKALTPMLNTPEFATQAEAIGQRIQAENGVINACTLLEPLLS